MSTSNNQPVSAGQSYAYASPAFAGQGNTGFALQETLFSSTTVNPVPVQLVFTLGNVSTIHNNPPFWTYNILPPAIKPTMPTTSTPPLVILEYLQKGLICRCPPLQWVTPMMPPGQVQSPSQIVDNTTKSDCWIIV